MKNILANMQKEIAKILESLFRLKDKRNAESKKLSEIVSKSDKTCRQKSKQF